MCLTNCKILDASLGFPQSLAVFFFFLSVQQLFLLSLRLSKGWKQTLNTLKSHYGRIEFLHQQCLQRNICLVLSPNPLNLNFVCKQWNIYAAWVPGSTNTGGLKTRSFLGLWRQRCIKNLNEFLLLPHFDSSSQFECFPLPFLVLFSVEFAFSPGLQSKKINEDRQRQASQ